MPRVRVNLEETQYDGASFCSMLHPTWNQSCCLLVDIDDDTYEDEPQDADGEDFDKGVRGRQFEFGELWIHQLGFVHLLLCDLGYNCSEEQLEGLR